MTVLLLYGFDDSRANALINDLRYQPLNAELLRAEVDFIDGNHSVPHDAIALVWGYGRSVTQPGSVSSRIAANGVPVVAITDESSIGGFDFSSGYIEVCFGYQSAAELEARIKTVKARATVKEAPTIVHGELTIDVERFAVSLNGRNIELTYKEYELLKLFASNPGRVFRREDILNRIWGDDYFGGTRTVDVHVRRLRSKLDHVSHPLIETMWRVGYRFTPADSPSKRSPEAASSHAVSN